MQVTPLIASTFWSDGGTTYGILPRTLWQRATPPDEHNRIRHHAHSWLVTLDDGRRGLLDTGCGSADLFTDKERAMHGLGSGWPLMEKLAQLGLAPEQIAFVVLSHLHWDHVGGVSCPAPGGGRTLAFPRAQHYVHRFEWEQATSGDPLFYKAYPPAVLIPLHDHPERLTLVTDDRPEILPGVRLERSGGHTRGHSIIALGGTPLNLVDPTGATGPRAARAVLATDVCPTQHHLRMIAQLSYDMYPLETRAWKRAALAALAAEGAVLLFAHDPKLYGGTLRADAQKEFVVDQPWPIPSAEA